MAPHLPIPLFACLALCPMAVGQQLLTPLQDVHSPFPRLRTQLDEPDPYRDREIRAIASEETGSWTARIREVDGWTIRGANIPLAGAIDGMKLADLGGGPAADLVVFRPGNPLASIDVYHDVMTNVGAPDLVIPWIGPGTDARLDTVVRSFGAKADIVVSDPDYHGTNGPQSGVALLFDGITGAQVGGWQGGAGWRLGTAVDAFDATPTTSGRVALGSPGWLDGAGNLGRVDLQDALTGAGLFAAQGAQDFRAGATVAMVGPDFIVAGNPGADHLANGGVDNGSALFVNVTTSLVQGIWGSSDDGLGQVVAALDDDEVVICGTHSLNVYALSPIAKTHQYTLPATVEIESLEVELEWNTGGHRVMRTRARVPLAGGSTGYDELLFTQQASLRSDVLRQDRTTPGLWNFSYHDPSAAGGLAALAVSFDSDWIRGGLPGIAGVFPLWPLEILGYVPIDANGDGFFSFPFPASAALPALDVSVSGIALNQSGTSASFLNPLLIRVE